MRSPDGSICDSHIAAVQDFVAVSCSEVLVITSSLLASLPCGNGDTAYPTYPHNAAYVIFTFGVSLLSIGPSAPALLHMAQSH
jgi:hypothetical protein